MVKFILSRLHPHPERHGFTLHMDKTGGKFSFANKHTPKRLKRHPQIAISNTIIYGCKAAT